MVKNIIYLSFFVLVLSSCNWHGANSKLSKDDSDQLALDSSVKKLNDYLSHDVISRSDINKVNDSALEDLIASNIYVNVKQTDTSTEQDYKNEFHKLTSLQQIFYSTLILERNVKLGGFKYYFENTWPVAEEASSGYKLLALPELSKIVDKVILIHQSNTADTVMIGKLDTLFLARIKQDNPPFFRIKLVRSNIDSFITK